MTDDDQLWFALRPTRFLRLRPALPDELCGRAVRVGMRWLAIVARRGRIKVFAVGEGFAVRDDDVALAHLLSAVSQRFGVAA